jgi:hypothetical protein
LIQFYLYRNGQGQKTEPTTNNPFGYMPNNEQGAQGWPMSGAMIFNSNEAMRGIGMPSSNSAPTQSQNQPNHEQMTPREPSQEPRAPQMAPENTTDYDTLQARINTGQGQWPFPH